MLSISKVLQFQKWDKRTKSEKKNINTKTFLYIYTYIKVFVRILFKLSNKCGRKNKKDSKEEVKGKALKRIS